MGAYFAGAVEAESEPAKAEAALEKSRTGLTPITFDITEMNFDHLRRKRAFYKNVDIQMLEEKDKEEIIEFTDLPDILPVKAAGEGYSDLKYDDLVKTFKSEEE